MMKEFLGTIRKFRLAVWFLCPSKQSIGPAFRNWINDPKYPGNLTAEWKKDLGWNAKYIKKANLSDSPKAFIFAKNYNWTKPVLVKVPITEWTKTKEAIRPGEYCYDHEASATFHVGDGFDWEDFNRYIGGTASIDLLPAIERYYGVMKVKEESEEESDDPSENVLDIATRMKDETGLPWKTIAYIVGMPRNTLTDRLKSTGRWNDEWGKDSRRNPAKTPVSDPENTSEDDDGVRQNEDAPSIDGKGGVSNPLYIFLSGRRESKVAEAPFPSTRRPTDAAPTTSGFRCVPSPLDAQRRRRDDARIEGETEGHPQGEEEDR